MTHTQQNNDTGLDTNNGAMDSYGDDCTWYSTVSYGCLYAPYYFDDEDFSANEMCCVCGGGETGWEEDKAVSGVFAIGFDGFDDMLLSGNFDTKTLNLPDLEDLETTLANVATNDAANERNVIFQNRGILMSNNKVRVVLRVGLRVGLVSVFVSVSCRSRVGLVSVYGVASCKCTHRSMA